MRKTARTGRQRRRLIKVWLTSLAIWGLASLATGGQAPFALMTLLVLLLSAILMAQLALIEIEREK